MEYLWLFPISVMLLIPLTFGVTYFIAVSLDHVDAVFPYISDTGTIPPESCIFGQFLSISAVLSGMCFYLRHRQIVEFYKQVETFSVRYIKFSTFVLWIGYASALGMSMVASFPEQLWFSAHTLGAQLAFGFGNVYCWAQCILSYKVRLPSVCPWMFYARIACTSASTISFIIMLAKAHFVKIIDDPAIRELVQPLRFDQDHLFYHDRMVSAICEWLMTGFFCSYFFTFALELVHAKLIPPRLIIISTVPSQQQETA